MGQVCPITVHAFYPGHTKESISVHLLVSIQNLRPYLAVITVVLQFTIQYDQDLS